MGKGQKCSLLRVGPAEGRRMLSLVWAGNVPHEAEGLQQSQYRVAVPALTPSRLISESEIERAKRPTLSLNAILKWS